MSADAPASSSRRLLLIESDGLVRSTVASVCRDMQLASVHQALGVAMGEQWLKHERADALLVSVAEGAAALDFLVRLRAGGLRCDAGLPVAVMAREVDAALVVRLKELDVRRLLLQPFKLRDVIHTVEHLWPVHETVAA